ncbi:MAG: fimbrillin family protein, partial [Candidatus Cryptobacteroides sp.]
MISKNITRMLLIAGVALVSCNENALEQDMVKGNVEVIATIDNEGLTRSCIDSTPYDGKTGILWTPDDCIGVFGSSTKNAEFTNTSTGNVATTGFTGTLDSGDAPQYAYYPYSDDAGTDVSALSGSVSATQSYSESTGLLSDDWKYGKLIATYTDGKQYKFKMTHLFALAKVVINATGTAIEGETLESISIKATSGSEIRRINGGFTFSAVDGKYSLTSASTDATTLVWSDKPALTSGKSYTGYISLIPNIA